MSEFVRYPMEKPFRVSLNERNALLRLHIREDTEWDEFTQQYLPRPVCSGCGEPWMLDGCATRRSVLNAAYFEAELEASQKKVAEVVRELGKVASAGNWKWVDGMRIVQMSMQVADFALRAGGIAVIDESLLGIRREIKAWFDKETASLMEEASRVLNEALANKNRRPRSPTEKPAVSPSSQTTEKESPINE